MLAKAMKARNIRIASGNVNLTLRKAKTTELAAETIAGVVCNGAVDLYDLCGQDNLCLTLGYIRWDNGAGEVRVLERHDSPERFDSRKNRARLEIKSYNVKEYYCALKQVRCKGDPEITKPSLHPTTLTELDAGARLDAGKLLKDVGATMIAMRDDIQSNGPDSEVYIELIHTDKPLTEDVRFVDEWRSLVPDKAEVQHCTAAPRELDDMWRRWSKKRCVHQVPGGKNYVTLVLSCNDGAIKAGAMISIRSGFGMPPRELPERGFHRVQ